jgi:aryl-alcohol dehydrogenase-like predicted oxidoreductase
MKLSNTHSSVLCLGTAQFGERYGVTNKSGKVSEPTLEKIFSLATSHGINTLDTAIAYGNAASRISRFNLQNWNICSKLPKQNWASTSNITEHVASMIDQTLGELNVTSLDTILLHNSADLASYYSRQIYDALCWCKKNQMVKHIGISIYSPDDYFAISSDYDLDVVQSPFNIFDQRLITSGLNELLISKGIRIDIRSIFLQGVLLQPSINLLPAYFQPWSKQLQLFQDYCALKKTSPLQACLEVAISLKNVRSILVGVENEVQLGEIINSCKSLNLTDLTKFSQDDVSLIDPTKWIL